MRQRTPASETFRAVDELLGDGNESQEPLDESEQDRLIQEFEALSVQQHRTWRRVIGGGLLAAGAFFAHAAWRQHVEPFGVRYTGELRSATAGPPAAATAALGCQAAALLVAAAGLMAGLPPPPLQPREAVTVGAAGRGSRRLGAGRGCLPFAARQWAALWGGVALAAVGAGYWGAALLRMVQLHGRQHGSRPELSWLPAGPLAGCLLAVYVAWSLADTERELQRLRSYRYRFKKA